MQGEVLFYTSDRPEERTTLESAEQLELTDIKKDDEHKDTKPFDV
jgi:hypothetical protein